MLGVNVKITGDAAFMKKLDNLGTTVLDWKEALDKTGKNLKAYFSGQVFDSQGGVFGTPWQSLSPATQVQKAIHYRQYAAVPLMATGNMRSSFKHLATSTHLEVSNTAPYFVYHQSTEEPRNKIPRRPMIAVNSDVKDIVRASFHKVLLEKMAGL